MKTFTIPAHKDIYKQLELLLSPNGLALVLGSNQNRTDAVSHEALNVILSQRPNWYDNEVLHTIGERDQYTDDWGIPLPSVDIDEVTSDIVIYTGAIRAAEKANLVLTAAEICPVIAVVHLTEGDPETYIRDRFAHMGCDINKVESVVKIVLQTED